MVKGVTHAHLGPIWYHSEPSDVPYSPNQILGLDFFSVCYSKRALVKIKYAGLSSLSWKVKIAKMKVAILSFEPRLLSFFFFKDLKIDKQ